MHLFILIFASLLIGVVYVFSKLLAVEKYSPATFIVLLAFFNTILGIPLLFYEFRVSSHLSFWLLALISAATYGVGQIFAFKAYKITDASIVGMVLKLSIPVTVLGGVVLLSESYEMKGYWGLALLLVGSLFITYTGKTIKFDKGILFSIIMALCFGLAVVFDKIILEEFSPFTYVSVNCIMITLMFSFKGKILREAIDLFWKKKVLVIITALLNLISWLSVLFILQSDKVSKVFPIYDSLSLVTTVFLGIVALKEKGQVWQKIVGTAVIIMGVVLLG